MMLNLNGNDTLAHTSINCARQTMNDVTCGFTVETVSRTLHEYKLGTTLSPREY